MGIKKRTAAIPIGGNARDKPLYLQVREGDSSLWFVIEDGRQQQEEEEELLFEKAKIGSDNDADDIIFRPLHLPQLSYRRFPHSLLVINSKLYLLGGSKSNNKRPEPVGACPAFHTEPAREYEYLDLQERRLRWRRQPFRQYPCTQHVASCKDGLIYGFAPRSYIMDPARRVTTELPQIVDEYGHVPQPLAISENKIYAYSRGGIGKNLQHYLFSYDMEEKKWDCLFRNFWGDWATGVVLVLSEDSYLIAYGSRHPIEWKREKAGVWVFDIRRRQWLDEPVEGLDEALPVIPDWAYDWDRGYTYDLPRLFQVGTHRFALVWEESDESYNLHCHKFTLQAPTSTDQPFVARQLSNKVMTLNGGNNKILGCTAGLETE